MTSFIFATHNENKVREVQKILNHRSVSLQSLKSINYTEEIAETGVTLFENAWIKADHLHDQLSVNIIAEDTGLEVYTLNMEPGVYSARYAGPDNDSEANMNKLLIELKDKEDRKARFRTVVAVWLNEKKHTFEGIVEGKIAHNRMGTAGFGYDPIFIPDGYQESFGQLPSSVKNTISHRAKAFEAFSLFLNSFG